MLVGMGHLHRHAADLKTRLHDRTVMEQGRIAAAFEAARAAQSTTILMATIVLLVALAALAFLAIGTVRSITGQAQPGADLCLCRAGRCGFIGAAGRQALFFWRGAQRD